MSNVELMWIYKHAWRGAGLYYRRGDHVVDTWIMPRCDVVPSEYQEDPEMWAFSNIDDIRGPRATPPIGPVRCAYILLGRLSHEQGNVFRIWYEELTPMERAFWQAFSHKAAQEQEHRWEDFRKEEPIPMDCPGVEDFDSRFFHHDSFSIVAPSLFHSTNRSTEEDKFEEWAIEEEDLEPGLAMDPQSYAAKALQRKRKDPPTEEDPPELVRKRPATPPTGQ